jgi:hypothetical protein
MKEEHLQIHDGTSTKLETLVRHRNYFKAHENRSETAMKIILAPWRGYLCRSDVLSFRMRHSELVKTVVEFSAWDEQLLAVSTHSMNELLLLPLLLSLPRAVVGKQWDLSGYEALQQLQRELEMRLSFNCVLPTKSLARRVAVEGGRGLCDEESGHYSSQCFFEAAEAPRIFIIIFDNVGY